MVLHFYVLVGLPIQNIRKLLRIREEVRSWGKRFAAVCLLVGCIGLFTDCILAIHYFALTLRLLVRNLPHLLSEFMNEISVIALEVLGISIGLGATSALGRR